MQYTEVEPKLGDLRVWWIPQVPMTAFHVSVANTKEARLILDTLAFYDIFQFKHRVKPDYFNAGGLEVYGTEGIPGWEEWEDEEGNDIDHISPSGQEDKRR